MFNKKKCQEELLRLKEQLLLSHVQLAKEIGVMHNTLYTLLADNDEHEWMSKTKKKVLKFIHKHNRNFDGFN